MIIEVNYNCFDLKYKNIQDFTTVNDLLGVSPEMFFQPPAIEKVPTSIQYIIDQDTSMQIMLFVFL